MTITHGPGRLVVFEGPDGAGKTTLISQFADRLRVQGRSVRALAFPGREPGSLGSLVYDIHHDSKRFGIASVTGESLQALHVAAHLDAIDRFIRPSFARGETVILDRYWWSTWVYGIDGGASRATIEALVECERRHWDSLSPDIVILVTRTDSLRPQDAGPVWTRRLALYKEVAQREGSLYPVRIISNNRSEADALARIISAVDPIIGPGLGATAAQRHDDRR